MVNDEHQGSLPSPIPNSYWVLPGRVLAGEYPGSASQAEGMQRVQRLLQAGVTSFLDLTEEDELPSYAKFLSELTEQKIRYRRWSITDHSIPESAARMADILDHLDAELAAGRCVYVHCRAGIGRTGTVIACHLIRSGLTNDLALDRLQLLWRQCSRSRGWPRVPETEEQVEFVRRWRDRDGATSAALSVQSRYEGAIVGLAIGDALGTAVSMSNFDAATLAARAREPGLLTSGADTAMTRAVLESLLAHRAHQPNDQLQRYLEWSRTTTVPIPSELKRALASWQWSKKPIAGSHDPRNLDPHTLARTLAVALLAAADVPAALALAVDVSRPTQQSPVVLDLCRVWAATLIDALHGASKADLVHFSAAGMQTVRARVLKAPVRELIDSGWNSESAEPADALTITQQAIDSFGAGASFREAILHCVTHSRAQPSAGALCGALAGAHYGLDAIAEEWRSKLTDQAGLRSLARHCLS